MGQRAALKLTGRKLPGAIPALAGMASALSGCVAPPATRLVMIEVHRAGADCRADVNGRPVGPIFAGTGSGDWELLRAFRAYSRHYVLVLADRGVPYRCLDVVLAGLQRAGASRINLRSVEVPAGDAPR